MAHEVSRVSAAEMTQPSDLAALSSQLLALPNAAIPFEVALNCALES
jgi:type II secretory pathway component PulF